MESGKTRKNREAILYSISKEFHIQYNIVKGVGQASIVTSIILDKKQLIEVSGLYVRIRGLLNSYRAGYDMVSRVVAIRGQIE